ncbi:MAG: DUF4160 domain-containing protein [Zetaproteobacteria bacterium]|nr:DUF4160 domain-containing protein [Zetaproteobacteria bacterium]
MPIVLIIGGLRFFFYSNEGLRPHIHVGLSPARKGGPEMKVWLDTLEIASSRGFNKSSVNRIHKFIEEQQEFLNDQWEAYFDV